MTARKQNVRSTGAPVAVSRNNARVDPYTGIDAAVYEGRTLLGFVCKHPTKGFIALSADRTRIGTTFPNRIAAMVAIKESSGKESETT